MSTTSTKNTDNAVPPTVSTGALPASRKTYHSGEIHQDLRVPIREIDVHASANEPAVQVYDTSGPYTDPDYNVDIERGLPRIRTSWAEERGDIETYEGRHVKPEDNGFVTGERVVAEFPNLPKPRRAKGDKAITQLAYARAGIITAEMEFAAIRENMGRSAAAAEALAKSDGDPMGAEIPQHITAEFVRSEIEKRSRHPALQREPSRSRTDAHRSKLPGEDQCKHRQLGRHLIHGRRSRKNGVVDPLGCRHGHGPVDRKQHPQHS